VAVLESKALTVVTPRAFRSGETARLTISTRNLETLTFSAYKLDPEAYFRKKHALAQVEALDIALVAPDAEWTADVPGFAKYAPIETSYELPKLAIPGVWVVKVTDEKTLQATTLVLGSDLDAIVKASREQVLVFAQDMKTGKGRPGARVLIGDGEGIVLEAKTGADGVLLHGWDKPRDPNSALKYLILDGRDVSGSGLDVPGRVAQGLSPRAYLYTDRPAYRPGQEVALRGVVREVRDGQYAHAPGSAYRLEVTDSRGRLIVARAVTLSPFGTFHERLAVDATAPVGTYRVRLFQPGQSEFAGGFEVQAYQLEKIDLTWDLPRTVYYRGETIKAVVAARYQYGTPLAGRPIQVALPDGRVLHGRTDAAGAYAVELPTEGFAEEQALRLTAQLPEDNVAATASVLLAVRAFRIDLATPRDVYLDGESIPLRATTLDAQGEPTGQELTVALLKRVEQAGRITEREVAREAVTTDPKTGVGTITPEGRGPAGRPLRGPGGGDRSVRQPGRRRARADRLGPGGRDQAAAAWPNGRASRWARPPGSTCTTARVRAPPCWPGRPTASCAIGSSPSGRGTTRCPGRSTGRSSPTSPLTAARMAENHFHRAQLDVRVERDLRVTIEPTEPAVGPGAEVEVRVTTTDQMGRPVAAELSLALVDRALLRLYGDRLPPIGPFF
jgi:hypothetical protein